LRGSLPIGRVLGIPILINVSWFASLLLIVSALSLKVFPSAFPGQGDALNWSLGLAAGLLFFLSLILHELGHCVVARHYGIPVSSITLFIFGGVSQITREAPRASAEFLMAIAGPAVSLVIGGGLIALSITNVLKDSPAGQVVAVLGIVNIGLGLFNLLPGFPLDGGRVLRSTIWGISGNMRLATQWAAVLGRGVAFLLIGVGLLMLLRVRFLAFLGEDWTGALWIIFVGLFLNRTAGQALRQSQLLEFLRGHKAEDMMDSDVPELPASAALQSFMHEQSIQASQGFFVVRDGRVIGMVPRERLLRVPPARWSDLTAEDVMIPADRISPANPQDDGGALLQRMDAEELACLPVVNDGSVIGLITRSAILRLLRGHRMLRLLRL
jgi:Zn-dependent protease